MAIESKVNHDDGWFVGEDKRLRFTIYTDRTQQARQDITGWTFAYDFYRDGEVEFTIDPGADLTITDAANGEVVVRVSGARTASLADLKNLHHVLRRTDEGEAAVISYGDVVVRPQGGV